MNESGSYLHNSAIKAARRPCSYLTQELCLRVTFLPRKALTFVKMHSELHRAEQRRLNTGSKAEKG